MAPRGCLVLVLFALATAPLAAAAQHTTQGVPNDEPPGEQESMEDEAGFSYGWFLILAVGAFAGVLAWVANKYAKRPPSSP